LSRLGRRVTGGLFDLFACSAVSLAGRVVFVAVQNASR